MSKLRIAVRARWIGTGVYVRKDDLLKWFDNEAKLLRLEGLDEKAEQTESLAAALRQVRAS